MHGKPVSDLQSQLTEPMFQLFAWLFPQPIEQPVPGLFFQLPDLPYINRMLNMRNRIYNNSRNSFNSFRVSVCRLQIPMRHMYQHSKLLHKLCCRIPVHGMEMFSVILLRFPGHFVDYDCHIQPKLFQLPFCPHIRHWRLQFKRNHNHWNHIRLSFGDRWSRTGCRIRHKTVKSTIQQFGCNIKCK